ncbi:MAG: prepilin-type N-terminal cleavage/methylation domain-containing protein [Proteobacteria bacterium]|nr:prepilin-type N-terminal cleavage/methylation domain-containing protein [Pseudomonadota bacterium]MBU1716391.1 prepilin-type N-terminal cleavage/methylation domain-containing protein [Pseudomonadota bacterium]
MKKSYRRNNHQGFSLIELMIVCGVIGILAAAVTPSVINWLPNHRLKGAARDLFGTLQVARLLAVQRGANVSVIFNNTVNPGFYYVDLDNSGFVDQPGESRVDLGSYGSGVDFGIAGVGLVDWTNVVVGLSVTYPLRVDPPLLPSCTFSSNGTITVVGAPVNTVYLINNQNAMVYAITTMPSGAIKMRKHSGIQPNNSNNWFE